MVTFLGPLTLPLFATVAFDIVNYKQASKIIHNQNGNATKMAKRAIAFSTILLMTWFVIAAILGNLVVSDLETKAILIGTIYSTMNALRNPIFGHLSQKRMIKQEESQWSIEDKW